MANGGAEQMGGSRRADGRLPLSDLRSERGDNPLSGRRGLEGNAAAFDMKSLDKHLEAVSPFLLLSAFATNLLLCDPVLILMTSLLVPSDAGFWKRTFRSRRDGNFPDSCPDRFLFLNRQTNNPRSRSEIHHA